jgi:hypothetical protein
MSTYDHIRFHICFIPWAEHSPDCPRHDHRPGAEAEADAMPVPDPAAGTATELGRLRAAYDRIEREAVCESGVIAPGRWGWELGRICSCTFATKAEALAAFRRRFGLDKDGGGN